MKVFHVSSIILIFSVFTSCATSVETTLKKEWEKESTLPKDEQIYSTYMITGSHNEDMVLVSTAGVQAYNSNGGEVLFSADREKFYTKLIESEGLSKFIQSDKITFIYVPHLHSVLEFDYNMTSESISLIDLTTFEPIWRISGINWSLERYKAAAQAVIGALTDNVGKQAAGNVASEMLLESKFIQELVTVVPEENGMVFKTLDGLIFIDLATGNKVWEVNDIKGGVGKTLYHNNSNSIVFLNSNVGPIRFEGIQFRKELHRINVKTGERIWTTKYDGAIRSKVDGVGNFDKDDKIDMRFVDNRYVLLNFLNMELFDFETGKEVFSTTTKSDKLLDNLAPEAQIMNRFAFPVFDEKQVFHVNFGNVGLSGVDITIQAFDLENFNKQWETKVLSRSRVVTNMLVFDEILVATLEGKEGIVGISRENGSVVWEVPLSGRGVTQHAYSNGKLAFIPTNDNVLALNPKDGTTAYVVPESFAKMITERDNKLLVLGSKSVGYYHMDSGELIKRTELPTGGKVVEGKGVLAIESESAEGAVHILRENDLQLLGSLGTNKARVKRELTNSAKGVYVLENNMIKYFRLETP